MSAPKMRFGALGERIAREEDELLARPLPAEEASLRASIPARPPRRGPWIAAAAAATLALVAGGAISVTRSQPLRMTVGPDALSSGSWVSAPASAPVPVRFSEGTEILLLPEAHARIAEVTRRGAHVLLESGGARVSVTPNRGGEWTFTAGPFQVEVKGTRFEVGWSPREQQFTLKLAEGSVFISGCALGDGHPLFAGETLIASCLTREFHIDRPASRAEPVPSVPSSVAALPTPPAPSALESSVPPPPSDPGARASEGAEGWPILARAGRYKEAYARLGDRGFDSEVARAGRDDLLLLGEVARLSGDPGRALAAYQRVRARAPGSEAAANAAFAMGRVDFDQRQAYAEAAAWFATYRSERADGPLARDATGRQMEALSRAGDAAGAARVAGEYLRRYPSGPHAPIARTLRQEGH